MTKQDHQRLNRGIKPGSSSQATVQGNRETTPGTDVYTVQAKIIRFSGVFPPPHYSYHVMTVFRTALDIRGLPNVLLVKHNSKTNAKTSDQTVELLCIKLFTRCTSIKEKYFPSCGSIQTVPSFGQSLLKQIRKFASVDNVD